ncbi:unnamed protein product [Leptidea sinapis]|uniref:Uncharacterized protein n=1 Tax=Leptidea sinapis TaxID=189913 RepID=A0A5E4Q8M7_9NEOP|nr:unnamed protein product [Leptidea sinapis]
MVQCNKCKLFVSLNKDEIVKCKGAQCDTTDYCKQVYELLKPIDLKKNSGPDHLPAEFIVAIELSLLVSLLFKISFQEGLVPLKLKTAYISPLHKKGSSENVENYRQLYNIQIMLIC